jgi:NCS1 family nucleobase:cation symporter-1
MPKPEAHDSYDPLTPVPQASRIFDGRDAFSLWFSLGIGLLVLQAGALLVPGLSLGVAFAAILVGTGFGTLLLAAAGVVGADTGLSAMGSLRPTLGLRGASIPAILNLVQLTGWGAFEIVVMRESADTLSRQTFGVSAPMLWTVLFGIVATSLAVLGPLSVVRRILRNWGMWLLLAGALWLTWRLLSRHDLMALLQRSGDGSMSFAGAVDLVIAMPLSWLPLIADYTRFGRSSGAMFRGSSAGYLIANEDRPALCCFVPQTRCRPRRVHPCGRGNRVDRADRRMGNPAGLPGCGGVAGRHWRVDQPVSASVCEGQSGLDRHECACDIWPESISSGIGDHGVGASR